MRVASIAFLLSIAVAVPVPAQTSSDLSRATGQAGGVTAEAPTDSAQTAMPEPGIIDRALTVANQWLVDSGAPARR